MLSIAVPGHQMAVTFVDVRQRPELVPLNLENPLWMEKRLTGTDVVRRISNYLGRWNKGSNLEGIEVAVSVGVAEWEEDKTLDEVLDAADQDMYAIKNGQAVKP